MKHRLLLFLSVCMLALCASAAHADTYTYDFYGQDLTGNGVGFQYSTNSLVTGPLTLTAAQLDWCTGCQATSGAVVFFTPDVPSYGDIVQVSDSTGYFNTYVFNYGNISSVGAWGTDWIHGGSLYVNVPESSSAGMTLAGAAMLAGLAFLKRKPLSGNLLA